jgi:predicted dehydrogenase
MTAYLEADTSGYNAQQLRNQADGVVINPLAVNTYRAEIEEFSNAILRKQEPKNNASLGLQNQIILAACYESARSGRIIEIK